MVKRNNSLSYPVGLAGHAFLVLLLVSLVTSANAGPDVDPLEVLCTGHAGSMPFMNSILKKEPMTDAVIIPTRVTSSMLKITADAIYRYMRLYFPRTYGELIEKYEFLILRGMDSTFFTLQQLEWMRRSIEEDGMGALNDRSVMSSLTSYSIPWAETSTSEAFPNDADAVVSVDYSKSGYIEILVNGDRTLPPILMPYIDLFDFPGHYSGNTLMIPREGTQVYSWVRSPVYSEFAYPVPGQFPHTLGWRYGRGYTWSLMDYSASGFWSEGQNPYGLDAYWGMLMYSTGRDLPGDVVMVHQLRIRFHEYVELKGFIFSMIDFIDRFGANTNALEEEILLMDVDFVESRALYLSQDYAESWGMIERLISEISLLRGRALEIKDRALLWIYVIEWFAVSGTFLAAGFMLWTLMIRRRLYRMVTTTRLR